MAGGLAGIQFMQSETLLLLTSGGPDSFVPNDRMLGIKECLHGFLSIRNAHILRYFGVRDAIRGTS